MYTEAEAGILRQLNALHRENKRECFDAMRAYHASEIAHKKDAVDILKAILATTIAIYGAIIGTLLVEKVQVPNLGLGLAASVVVIALVAYVTVHFTNKKIDTDNARYEDFQNEYLAERVYLGIENDLEGLGYFLAWSDRHAGAKIKGRSASGVRKKQQNTTGYGQTKGILLAFFATIVLVAVVGASGSAWVSSLNKVAQPIEDAPQVELQDILDRLEGLEEKLVADNLHQTKALSTQHCKINAHLDRHLNIVSRKLKTNSEAVCTEGR